MSADPLLDLGWYDPTGRRISGSGEQHSGQVRMAYRLARSHVDKLLHVRGLGWHYWDGKRWKSDGTTVEDAVHARHAVLDILREALTESFVGDKRLRADVSKCESHAGIKGVLGVASALVEFAATVHDVDADPFLLNCANGTLDLRDRQLRAHNPADRLTKVTTGAYEPDADPAVWTQFLASVIPDEAERDYLRRVFGQCIYGRVREHLFPVLRGEGANGKGTTYNAVTHALGDYATIINPEILMVRDHGGSAGGPELMALIGVRLVIGSETGDGRKLDEATMKRLTGGDELTARNLYSSPVTWLPSHQLVYVTNKLPKVRGNDPAAWRRIRVVPFDVVIPTSDWDLSLGERLTLHADAILSWVIAGHFDHEDNGGMREPPSVLVATTAYQSESDAVSRFVVDACIVSTSSSARTRELFSAWQKWSISDGAEVISEKAFGNELDRLGYTAKKTKHGAVRAGLTPLNADSESLL